MAMILKSAEPIYFLYFKIEPMLISKRLIIGELCGYLIAALLTESILARSIYCRMMQRLAILAHNQKVVGSNPTPAPKGLLVPC